MDKAEAGVSALPKRFGAADRLRFCSDCPAAISSQNKSGRCRMCCFARNNADPAFDRRRTDAIRARFKDPEVRARAAREIHIRHLVARQDPEVAARLDQNIRQARKCLNDPDVRAKFLATREEAGRKRSETVMAWCPEEYRAEYAHLTRSKRLSAAQARNRILSKMTPFERQMHALKRGARLVEKPRHPGPAYDYTLGGVTDL